MDKHARFSGDMGEPVEDACKISKGAGLGPSHL
jgi:hypothetical protein